MSMSQNKSNHPASERGIIRLNFRSTSPADIIEVSVKPLRQQLHEKEIDLIVEIDHQLGKIIMDAEKIAWIMVSLISNSIRYTPRWGKIKVIAKPEEDHAIFIVEDNGQGIADEHLESIFNSMLNKDNQKSAGLGLALTISREIIHAHGGQIWVESHVGKGTSFSFTLPFS